MAIEIKVPNLGESINEATVASWLKKPGDSVAADETLLELETDKATLEVPAPSAGVLQEILVEEGEDVEVGAVLGRLEEGAAPEDGGDEAEEGAGETSSEESAAERTAESKGERAEALQETEPEVETAQRAEPEPSGAGRHAPTGLAQAAAGLDPESIPRSGPDGSVTLADLKEFFQNASREAVERSGPAVRKLIADHGLDPARLSASGRDGRITKDDVLQYLSDSDGAGSPEADGKGAEARTGAPAAGGERREERVRMSRLRRTIATRLKEAQNNAAILTTFNEADMSAVKELRRRHRDTFEEKHGVRLGFMSFFVKAVVGALKEMPNVNASIDGDEILYKYYYDIGIAVSTDAGLKVPIVRDSDSKSFPQIEKEIAELAEKARDGSLQLEEMEGGTFTISNGGVFGSLLSTPILNPPQSAILGLHKIEERPVVIDGEVVVRPMMYLALSYDHRLIDGRESVTFLVKVKELIEDPERLLLDL